MLLRLFLYIFVIYSSFGATNVFAQESSLDINSDLVKILDTFDDDKGENPNDVPRLEDLLNAKGTLVFFDNSNSTDKKPKLGNLIQTRKSNFLEKTLNKARKRLLGTKRNISSNYKPVFSDRSRQSGIDVSTPQNTSQSQTRFLELDYDGDKTVAMILPNTLIEVPFYKHIPYFFSHIEILGNGDIKVTETIQRVVEKKETDFSGINRYFPKYHYDRTGKKRKTDLMVLEASIDKQPAYTELLPKKNGLSVYLHSETPLTAGTHLFSITYLFSNKVAVFKNDDENAKTNEFKELIWDVTGRQWDIPITRAAAAIIFPSDSVLYSQAAITSGFKGSSHNYKITKDKENNLSYVLTFPLDAHEGLTILANWGETNPSPFFQNGLLDKFMLEHGTMFVSFVAFLFVLSYYLATWFGLKKNKTPTKTHAAPLQKGNLSAGVLDYALNKKITHKSLLIILLNMASKGFVSFDEKSDGTLIIIKQSDKLKGLSNIEKKVAKRLFSKDTTSLSLTNANILKLNRVLKDIEKTLKREYKLNFTSFPQGYFLFGIIMAIVAIIAISSLSLFPRITAITSFASILCFIPALIFAEKLFIIFKNKAFKSNKVSLIKYLVGFIPFTIALTALQIYYAIQTTPLTAIFFCCILINIGIFKSLLRSSSALGVSLLENIEGYKLYLSSQDDTLLTMMRNAEQKIKTLYSKHLPFAVAMKVEQLWTKRFVAFSEQENALKPEWYKGKLDFNEEFIDSFIMQFDKVFAKNADTKKTSRPSRFKK